MVSYRKYMKPKVRFRESEQKRDSEIDYNEDIGEKNNEKIEEDNN